MLWFLNFDDSMQTHFENIQRIANTTTMPHAMHYLSSRIAEELDLTHLTERLMRGKGQPNTLTSAEKLELWGQLKILSMSLRSLSCFPMCHWAMTSSEYAVLGHTLIYDTPVYFITVFHFSLLIVSFRFHENVGLSLGNDNTQLIHQSSSQYPRETFVY